MTKLMLAVATTFAMAASTFAQQRFDSADAAAQALIDGAAKHDAAQLAAILGPQAHAVMTSGNPEQDRSEQSEFAKLAGEKHKLIPCPADPNRMILSIGDADWPFPIPIVRTNGKWAFDASQAKVEMEARRIGAHELDAIEILAGYVQAQHTFASEDRDEDGILEYASHMSGSKTDGLYWEGASDSLVPRGLAEATWDGQKKPLKPYHGYYFRILEGQGANAPGGAHTYVMKNKLMGGFGLVAWPAQYGVTGIHTFIVNQDGVIYQKDIAPSSPSAPSPITIYDPDPSWTAVQ